MRRKDFIANPQRVGSGENSNGFRAVTPAEDVTENPMPKQHCGYGPNVNGTRWSQFPCDTDVTPPMVGRSKRVSKAR